MTKNRSSGELLCLSTSLLLSDFFVHAEMRRAKKKTSPRCAIEWGIRKVEKEGSISMMELASDTKEVVNGRHCFCHRGCTATIFIPKMQSQIQEQAETRKFLQIEHRKYLQPSPHHPRAVITTVIGSRTSIASINFSPLV